MVPDPDHVADQEWLYRSVRQSEIIYENGHPRPSSQAFADRTQQVSVDRALLIDNDPRRTQKSETDAVVSLLAAEVRGIHTLIRRDAQGNKTGVYAIDVRPDPLPDNPAHALIVADPEFASSKHFRKLRESLARLAQIVPLP
jgi:hypothetical protein